MSESTLTTGRRHARRPRPEALCQPLVVRTKGPSAVPFPYSSHVPFHPHFLYICSGECPLENKQRALLTWMFSFWLVKKLSRQMTCGRNRPVE